MTSDGRDRLLLIVISASDAGHQYVIDGSMRLGRDSECEIRIDDAAVSRFHATVRPATGDGRAEVVDESSRNGTFVNGHRVQGGHPLRDGDRLQVGPHAQFRFAVTDASEEELLRKLYESSARDPLTGAANRRHLLDRVGDELAYAQRHGKPVALLLFDVAALDEINASHGHVRGDRVLREVARTMHLAVRQEDLVARWGGGTFAVLARGIGVEGAATLAGRVREVVEAVQVGDEADPIALCLHVGVAVCDPGAPDASVDGLTRAVLDDLKRAKGGG